MFTQQGLDGSLQTFIIGPYQGQGSSVSNY